MKLPIHIRAASDRCKDLRETIWQKEAMLEYLHRDRWWGEGWQTSNQTKALYKKKVKEIQAIIKPLKEKLFELEDQLTYVLLEIEKDWIKRTLNT